MKNHLKSIAAPRTWVLARKKNTFVVRPSPSGHPLDMGLPLSLILRDKLNYASATGEVKKLLNNNEVLVNGKRCKNHRFLVGIFDIISIPSLKKYYTIKLDSKGRIIVSEIAEKDSKIKLSKIVEKTVLKKGKIQFNLHDGNNVISNKEAKVGDSLILNLPNLEINEILPLKVGVSVFLIKGNHGGSTGVLKEIKENKAVCLIDKNEIETAKKYLFVINKGEKK